MRELFSRLFMNIVYFGTSLLGATVLDALCDGGFVPRAVATPPDAARQRGQRVQSPLVKERAHAQGIPVLQPKKLDAAFVMELRMFAPDVFCVAEYGTIIPTPVLDLAPLGALNVH